VGAIQHALLDAGVQAVTSVDASLAYLTAARAESLRRGLQTMFPTIMEFC